MFLMLQRVFNDLILVALNFQIIALSGASNLGCLLSGIQNGEFSNVF